MASTINFNNHIRQFNDTMRGMARILYVGAGYDLSTHRILASKPWRRIYTTSLDPELSQYFSRDDRQVRAIYDIASLRCVNTVLDRKNPLLVFLSPGCEEPTDIRQKLERQNNRLALCATLDQIMNTDLVNLIIVGYNPSLPGELSTEEIGKLFMNHGERCVTFYGLNEDVEKDPYIQMLVNDGIATVFSQDLGDALESVANENEKFLEETTSANLPAPDDLHGAVFISGQPCQLEPSLCYEFARYGRLLSIREMDAGVISRMLQVDYFYRFLKRSPYEPQWYGYNRRNGFAVRREFENSLYSAVITKLATGASNPIILVGQTSSGKSVALAALAYQVFQEHKYPVLFVTNPETTFAADTPSFQALDNLLLELEKQGAERVLLIIDYSVYNLQRNDSIRRIMDRCINRGRKVVIVASAIQKANNGYEIIEAPIQLTEGERKAFGNLLAEKGKLVRNQVERWLQLNIQDANLLSMLYRLLWDIHPELEHGLNVEISKGLEDTKAQLQNLPLPELVKEPLSAIAAQLVKLELIADPNTESTDGAKSRQVQIVASLQPFCESLAVASLFKLRMPITMAMRLLNIPSIYSNRQQYLKVVFNSPWLNCVLDNDEYAEGKYYVTFRTPSDAHIYLASLNINNAAKMRIVANTISSLKEGSFYNDEIKFIEQLIRMIGPNSDDNNIRSNWFFTYGNGCPQVIDALEGLRNNRIIEPQLVAQEITYIREYYGDEHQDAETRIINLESAISIARNMLDLASRPMNDEICWKPGLIDSISVESIFSELRLEEAYRNLKVQGRPITHNPNVPVFVLNSYAERQHKLMEVIESQPENSYAYTALLSCYNSYYYDLTISRGDRLTQLASVLEIVDNVSTSIPTVETNESYQKVKYEFTEIFSCVSSSKSDESYFQKLFEMGSAIGVYMKARTMLSKAHIQYGKKLSKAEIAICKETLELLEDIHYAGVVKSHAASQYMRLQLKWLCCNGGEPIFAYERQCTHISEADWASLYSICTDFKSNIIDRQLDCSYISTVYYILALAAAQLGDYETAVNTWRLVHENDFYSVGRQITWHILCKPDGEPMPFTGTFNTQYPLPERRIYIKELQRQVLYPSLQSLNKSEPIGEVHDLCIGTSYRGFSAFTRNWTKRRT